VREEETERTAHHMISSLKKLNIRYLFYNLDVEPIGVRGANWLDYRSFEYTMVRYLKLIQKIIVFPLFLIPLALSAQVKGRVIDHKSGETLPYVNIVNTNNNRLFTSDERGRFQLEVSEGDSLSFSCVGFEDLKMAVSDLDSVVRLQASAYNVPVVQIFPSKSKTNRLGKLNRSLFYATHTNLGATRLKKARFIPYDEKCDVTPFIKRIRFATKSKVQDALISVSLWQAGPNGKPDTPIHPEQFIVHCGKGLSFNELNLDSLTLIFPRRGLFVVFEWLNLPQNMVSYEKKEFQNPVTEICPALVMESSPSEEAVWIFGRDGWVPFNFDDFRKVQLEVVLEN